MLQKVSLNRQFNQSSAHKGDLLNYEAQGSHNVTMDDRRSQTSSKVNM